MRRRSSRGQDSLELLLDTICNTFGGVLFIAILIIIMIQTTSSDDTDIPEDTVSAAELQNLENQLYVLQAELQRLQELKASQDQLVEELAPAQTRELIRQRNQLAQSFRTLQEKSERQQRDNSENQARMERLSQEIEDSSRLIEQLQMEVAERQAEWEKTRQLRTQDIKMPVTRSAGLKQSVGLILRYGRMYVWHHYDASGNRLGLNTEEFIVVDENANGIVTTPNPAAGIPLRSDEASKTLLRRRLQRFRPQKYYLTLVVRPDSYDQFRHLRDVILDMGFEYRLMPMDENGAVMDRGGRGGRVQ